MTQSSQDHWIQGDGGPTVVLQATAAAIWRGALDFESSLMRGGTTETDYDVICECEDGVTVIHRYGRDMLVLSDTEWATRFMPASLGDVVLLQWFGSDSTPEDLVANLTESAPQHAFRFDMRDTALRLLAGADDGAGELYGYTEAALSPGLKICEVYRNREAQVVVIRSAGEAVPHRREA